MICLSDNGNEYITLGFHRQQALEKLALEIYGDDRLAISEAAKLPFSEFRFVMQYIMMRQVLAGKH